MLDLDTVLKSTKAERNIRFVEESIYIDPKDAIEVFCKELEVALKAEILN